MKRAIVKVTNSQILCSTDYFFPAGKKRIREKWLKEHTLFEAETNAGPRIVTPVTILGDEDQVPLMMDAITGTLYKEETGECLTSINLKMLGYKQKRNLKSKLSEMGHSYEY